MNICIFLIFSPFSSFCQLLVLFPNLKEVVNIVSQKIYICTLEQVAEEWLKLREMIDLHPGQEKKERGAAEQWMVVEETAALGWVSGPKIRWQRPVTLQLWSF